MAICTVCGGRRTPIPGLRWHPNCYPDELVLWPEADQRVWLATRAAQNTADQPPQRPVGATGDEIR